MYSVTRQDSHGLGDSYKHEGTLTKMGKATSRKKIGKACEITEPQAQCTTEEQFDDQKQFHSKENVQPFIKELYQDSSPKIVTRRQSEVYIPYNEHNNRSENHFSGKKIDKSDPVFVTRFNIIILYLLLIALAVIVVCLVIKIQDIENTTNDLRRCRCEQVIGNKNIGPPSPFEDVPKDNSQDSNALFKYFNTEDANIKISPKLKKGEFIESSRNGASHIRTRRAVEGTPYEQNSSEEKSKRDTSDVTSVFTGAGIFETSEVNESRHIRIKRADTNCDNDCKRKQYCEMVSKCVPTAKPERLKVQSFEGNFYDIFPRNQHFGGKGTTICLGRLLEVENSSIVQKARADFNVKREGQFLLNKKKELSFTTSSDLQFTSHPKWDPSIQAFSNNSIYFPAHYMELPFYKETNETVNKTIEEKLVYQNQNKTGVFTVQEKGTYLVHVNITIIKDTKSIMPYLALFLNNYAVLVCPPGGFRCTLTNEEHIDRYRICNISGMLKLNINDTLQIKTMVPNMEVLLKNSSKSFFIIALLK